MHGRSDPYGCLLTFLLTLSLWDSDNLWTRGDNTQGKKNPLSSYSQLFILRWTFDRKTRKNGSSRCNSTILGWLIEFWFQGIVYCLVLFAMVQLRPGKNTVCECVSVLINSLWSSSQRRLCAPNLELLLCATSVALNVQREVHWIASFRADTLWTNSPQTLFHCLIEDITLHGNSTLCIVHLLKLLFYIQRISMTLSGEIV